MCQCQTYTLRFCDLVCAVFNGPAPAIRRFGSQEEELSAVAALKDPQNVDV